MKKLSILLLFLLISGSISCIGIGDDSSKLVGTDDDVNKIVGKWEWVLSGGGMSGRVHNTPESTGHSGMFEFDKNGNYIKYTDGIAVESGIYELKVEMTSRSAEPLSVIYFLDENNILRNYPDSSYVCRIRGDTLDLASHSIDGVSHEYLRVSG